MPIGLAKAIGEIIRTERMAGTNENDWNSDGLVERAIDR
jgi:hypothetical protein